MSNIVSQAVLSRTEVQMDLGINAIDSAVVRMPYMAGAADLRATKIVAGAAVRMPYMAGAADLRATKNILTVG